MRFIRRLGKRGQSGQSLVILAIGFLALLGFVGIVTDVSVLFIRYSTMRRAVDAAAIAAAGQMRRVQDTLLASDDIADGQAASVANLNLAARQFIEVYGLNPKSVIVETCGTQNVARDADGNAVDGAGQKLLVEVPDTDTVDPDDTKIIENPLADQATIKRYKQLCTNDELKLVRVTAQIDAPTIFLRLLGYPTVTLTESAISQTAVIDVVLIFDVSESMVNETEYSDWDHIPGDSTPRGVYYMPPWIDPSFNPAGFVKMASTTQTALNVLIAPGTTPDPAIQDVTVAFEPTTALNVAPGPNDWRVYTTPAASPVGRVQPREFCQVRGYQATTLGLAFPDQALATAYQNFFNNVYTPADTTDNYAAQFGNGAVRFRGFVPQYNYYGCCNDPLGVPDADGNFSFRQLICQPFKEARDAAHSFLDRLDFLRGDRVGFVTFDRQAYMVDADGETGPQGVMIETQTDIPDPDHPGELLRKGADNVLDDVVGVRTDGSGYTDGVAGDGSDSDGLWDHLINGGDAVTFADLMGYRVGDITDAPVRQSCQFDNASIPADYMTDEQRKLPDGSDRAGTLLDSVVTMPGWFFSSPYIGDGYPYSSYEYRAVCAGTNIGAALQTGSAALYNEGRREGAVWIMVLLSDGAAGASNPITRYDGQEIIPVRPYSTTNVSGVDYYTPVAGLNGPDTSPRNAGAAGYGFYGLCPYGTAAQPSQLLVNDATYFLPFCMDLKPQTRHYCGTVAISPDLVEGSILDADPNCFNYYNVDDYARDWADWIGVAELNVGNIATSGRVGEQLLPTIFTIGFGINYDTDLNGNHLVCHRPDFATDILYYNCIRGINQNLTGLGVSAKRVLRDRNSDYLGEELLRYIADVGDNNQIDSDWWQLCESIGKPSSVDAAYRPPCRDDGVPPPPNLDNRIGNEIDLTTSAAKWGARGACENEWPSSSPQNQRGDVYDPKPPMQPCGNYFVAVTGQQLEAVFDQIASRMFTRLSQ